MEKTIDGAIIFNIKKEIEKDKLIIIDKMNI